jgi:hypothetical protein
MPKRFQCESATLHPESTALSRFRESSLSLPASSSLSGAPSSRKAKRQKLNPSPPKARFTQQQEVSTPDAKTSMRISHSTSRKYCVFSLRKSSFNPPAGLFSWHDSFPNNVPPHRNRPKPRCPSAEISLQPLRLLEYFTQPCETGRHKITSESDTQPTSSSPKPQNSGPSPARHLY